MSVRLAWLDVHCQLGARSQLIPVVVDATNNWWGTTDEAVIDQFIYDYNDDLNTLKVVYEPYTTSPILGVP